MDVSSDSVLVKFEKESVVWYGVKSLGKIHDYEIGLLFLLKGECQIMDCLDELGFAGMVSSESMLFVSQYIQSVEVFHYVRV